MSNVKTYKYFCIISVTILIIGFVFNAPLDIQLHDTYIATSRFQVCLLVSIFLFLSGIGYYLLRKNEINQVLKRIHVGFTLVGFSILILSIAYDFHNTHFDIPNYYSNKHYVHISVGLQHVVASLFIVLGFATYILNISIHILRKIKCLLN